jgi:hypothetical protein
MRTPDVDQAMCARSRVPTTRPGRQITENGSSRREAHHRQRPSAGRRLAPPVPASAAKGPAFRDGDALALRQLSALRRSVVVYDHGQDDNPGQAAADDVEYPHVDNEA